MKKLNRKKLVREHLKTDSRCQTLYNNQEELLYELNELKKQAERIDSSKKIRIQEEENFLVNFRQKMKMKIQGFKLSLML